MRFALISGKPREQVSRTAQELGADALFPKFPPPDVIAELLVPRTANGVAANT